jgi:hypothetical protein
MSEPSVEEDAPRIAWETAEVSGGELRVSLDGATPKRWRKRFTSVLDRLDHDAESRWGAVKVANGEITVRDVTEGCEEDLHHQLESALLQANADLVAATGDDDRRAAQQSPEQQRDGRMTAAFRGFATTPS